MTDNIDVGGNLSLPSFPVPDGKDNVVNSVVQGVNNSTVTVNMGRDDIRGMTELARDILRQLWGGFEKLFEDTVMVEGEELPSSLFVDKITIKRKPGNRKWTVVIAYSDRGERKIRLHDAVSPLDALLSLAVCFDYGYEMPDAYHDMRGNGQSQRNQPQGYDTAPHKKQRPR